MPPSQRRSKQRCQPLPPLPLPGQHGDQKQMDLLWNIYHVGVEARAIAAALAVELEALGTILTTLQAISTSQQEIIALLKAPPADPDQAAVDALAGKIDDGKDKLNQAMQDNDPGQ